MKKIKFIKIKKIFKGMPEFLTRNVFSTFLILLILALLFGIIVFYFYVISIETPDKIDFGKEMTFKINEESHQRVLSQWQTRDRNFLEIGLRDYPDIFRQNNDSEE